jgi:small subunit ribosomal protein S2
MMEEDKAEDVVEEIFEDVIEEVVEEAEDDLDESELAESMAETLEEEASDFDVQGTLDDIGDDEQKDEESGSEPDTETGPERTDDFLVSRQKYLASGIHIGMKQRTKQMMQFVYKIRPDGLAVMNLKTIDERIRIAAKFISKNERIVVVSRRGIAHKAIEKFAEVVGAKAVKGRFMPGTLTNPNYEGFYESDVVIVVDPMSDYQAVREATTARIPIMAIADTFNETNNIDLVIPANNKGAKSIATLFWLLAREILKEQGKLKSDDEYPHKVEDFMKEMEHREREFDSDRPRRRGVGDRERGRGREQDRGRGRSSTRGRR